MLKNINLTIIAFLLLSCGGPEIDNFDDIVRKRAAQDFKCEQQFVKTIQLSLNEYIVNGCGRQARYDIECSDLASCKISDIVPVKD